MLPPRSITARETVAPLSAREACRRVNIDRPPLSAELIFESGADEFRSPGPGYALVEFCVDCRGSFG